MPSGPDELFPEFERVIYEKSPLTRVICQLRFPTILRIEAEIPSTFQEQIRAVFPLYERVTPLPPDVPAEMAKMIAGQIGAATTTHRFYSEDKQTFVALESGSMSLTSHAYTRWEHFFGSLQPVLDALAAVYAPSFFTRIGLRYIDLIKRSSIGLDGVPWSELLNERILGELSIRAIEENVQRMQKATNIRNSDGTGGLTIQQALNTPEGEAESQYTIDLDFYHSTKAEVNHAPDIINRLHRLVGSAFRWCITGRLHEALEPRPTDQPRVAGSDRV